MNNSILTTTTKNTTPHRQLNDEQFNPQNNKITKQNQTKQKVTSGDREG
jgi:hypothetical protein